MSARLEVWLYCDGCDRRWDCSFIGRPTLAGVPEAIAAARKAKAKPPAPLFAGQERLPGWSHRGDVDLCPSCTLKVGEAQPTLDLGGAA